jgi:2-polyprenyl-3-methyl-5-hydroxy-6-metoxy-1,4-benzoquinol methylase
VGSRLQQISARLRNIRDSDGLARPSKDWLERFVEELESAVSRNDKSTALGLIGEYRVFVERVEEVISPLTEQRLRDLRPLALRSGIQSQQFMIDLLPLIQAFLNLHPRGSELTVLDVGAGTGHGSNLLASLYASKELGYRLRVTALDVNDLYELYIAAACRHVRFIKQNIFRLDRTYDIVIASHVIEHVPEPLAFCRQLQRLATGAVFIVTPFKEPEENRTQGHINSFDESFVEELAPKSFQIVNSESWGRFMEPPYEMLIAELDPLADQL